MPETEDGLFEIIQSEEEDKEADVASYKIIYYGADYTLSVLYQKITEHDIIIPEFQRQYVWTQKQASKLIESFLLGLPVPPVFLYKTKDEKYLVVDGHQRLRTIQYFMDGKFQDKRPFSLIGVKPRWEGKVYTELLDVEKRKIKDSILRATIFQQTDPKDNSSIFEIFERLNTGGVVLKDQEIRNCIYRGHFNDLLKKLNEYKEWRDLIGRTIPDTRMRDVELILRFFALFFNLNNYSKPMKQFLNNFMKDKQELNRADQERYEKIFRDIIEKIYKGLGVNAFKISTGLNVALFDALTVGLATSGVNFTNLKSVIDDLLKNSSFKEAIEQHTTDKDKVEMRIRLVKNRVSKYEIKRSQSHAKGN
ncbi:MAG: DUF262 domain-containing protein [Candidatus Diapherotrites archaeon]|nr:DUF262 domain-containing protein [Candidatus Diapherotrites archaeon]